MGSLKTSRTITSRQRRELQSQLSPGYTSASEHFHMVELKGVLVALVTAWTDDQKSIDKQQLIFDAGNHGLVPVGTTGEFTAMTIAERKQLIELCVQNAAGRGPVVAGTGATSTQDAIELAEHAAKAGAAALMVVPPIYDPVNYEQCKELMSEIQ
ncbi:hypothetical protein HRR83_000985 [Exophiala dermatitidis]|uniref:Dihydrodipicolinate synthase family protein n=1 Tax=Exophiala dermatitidis TaxID=5970 RepID=A0AAN6F622_EXODE|nr:hypothetical protein HRR75_000897 [Exophiala dermatitidis]KAJ4528234.1 hypothetical protein HRR74_000989 [Exophiala dermatitidis]KAJ4528867.1 hypothetical protein HRR73_001490 [Exophiala dermatitidis]KAJ4530258.1 hypothetical protein HRR76_009486 [Exophiala dermatitidis]KAJ4553193.1 hypothetical protein HRR78_003452 [Exophiala dermatitidis]